MTEVKDAAVFTDKLELFGIDVNDQLCPLNSVISVRHNIYLNQLIFNVPIIVIHFEICLKTTQNVVFEFMNFGIFHQLLSF